MAKMATLVVRLRPLRAAVICLLGGLLLAAASPAGAAVGASHPTLGSAPVSATAASDVLSLAWSSAAAGSGESVAWGDYDADGDLDLVVGNGYKPDRLYRNDDGIVTTNPVWSSAEWDLTTSLAWGDYDGDGDLDLVTGNDTSFYYSSGEPNRLYRNEGGILTASAVWTSAEADRTRSLAWGDYDGDGDLDLVVGNAGNWGQPNRLYRNDGGTLVPAAVWSSAEADITNSVAWGDFDGDGDLDLAVGNGGFEGGQPNRLYRNEAGVLAQSAVWSSVETDNTASVAWGDYDDDGDLDLAAGGADSAGIPVLRLYANDGGQINTSASWSATGGGGKVAWGDYDGDGDLDLAAGRLLYRNDGGEIAASNAWEPVESDTVNDLAWGDYDGDGDLDLAVGTGEEPTRVYSNGGGVLHTGADWSSSSTHGTYSVAWGDYDGNGSLDLAAGTCWSQNLIYRNVGGVLATDPSWSSEDSGCPKSVAWGDYDGDGDLDLAAGPSGQPVRVYRSDNGVLPTTATWSSASGGFTSTIIWGDYDGDGDLDLAGGVEDGGNFLFRNDEGSLTPETIWTTAEAGWTASMAWGDYDGDGDLDMAVGNGVLHGGIGGQDGEANRLYRNDGGVLTHTAVWTSDEVERTYSVAWGDYDGDGDLDLAAGNWGQPIRLYRNDSGVLTIRAVWSSILSDLVQSVAWGDYDGDGDLDLAAGNWSGRNRLYRNDHGVLTADAAWSSSAPDTATSVAWGDYDGDGDLDLAAGAVDLPDRVYGNTRAANRRVGLPGAPALGSVHLLRPTPPGNADFLSTSQLWPASGSTIPIQYTLRQPDSRPVAYIRAYYSLNGGGKWLPAIAASGTVTTNLTTSPTGMTHTFNWDVFASGFFGQSDNVVFRIVAVPDLHPVANSVPGPFLYGSNASSTFPFRVRGTQVRVMEDGRPVKDALVYRRPAGSTAPAQPIGSLTGEPFKTDGQGYLQGRGSIGVGDRLYALAPITATAAYTLYHTNGVPTPSGFDGFTVSAPGVQTIDVSPAHPLVLFNLDVSLEWDARNDEQYLSQLGYDLQRASEFLWDWTNGQAAVGAYRVHQARELWQDAHIRIYATNRLRPSAVQGGVISTPYTDTVPGKTIVYYPGQLYMGASWNRYGNPGSNLDQDWPRTLAHELGHYVFYLGDNYLGKNGQGQVIPVDGCSGAMADPYRDDDAQGYGEFHTAAGWLPSCAQTLSHLDTGRADWTTITTFYPQLEGVATNPGPTTLPLALTQVDYLMPPTPPAALEAPIFFLTQDGWRVQPGSTARAFLYRGGWATDLGRPTLDQLLARGAQVGDRVCLYEPDATRLGCETVSLGDEQLALVSKPGWTPDIQVSPVTSKTLTIDVTVDVTNLPAGPAVKARLYPLDSEAAPAIELTRSGDGYTGTFDQPDPTYEGYVLVWVDEPEPRREALVDFTLGGNPGHQRTGGTGKRSDGGHQRTGGAPVMSADGQVILFAPDVETPDEWFYTLQAVASGVTPPPWATQVGQAYRLTASTSAPSLAGSSLSFSYLGGEVPPGEEEWLKLYFYDGSAWRQLTTSLDMYHNLASAQVYVSAEEEITGQGVYALMSSIEVPIEAAGWNWMSYPVPATRPVANALVSATGYYTTVYGYEPLDTLDPWKVYDVAVPEWVNDLTVPRVRARLLDQCVEGARADAEGRVCVDDPTRRHCRHAPAPGNVLRPGAPDAGTCPPAGDGGGRVRRRKVVRARADTACRWHGGLQRQRFGERAWRPRGLWGAGAVREVQRGRSAGRDQRALG